MICTMPKVVTNQRAVFETSELFRRLSNDSEIKYIGYINSTLEERRARFHSSCQNGYAEIAFVNCGLNLSLQFFPWNAETVQGISPSKEYVNFDQEPGKVYLRAPIILNGVCVFYKGWINMQHLDGMGHIEFDEERAQIEAVQQTSSPSSDIRKLVLPKAHNLKHSARGENSSKIEKRPRFC